MKQKLKICSICNKPSYLFKSSPPICKSCWNKTAPPIKKMSDKYKELLEEYKPLRQQFLLTHPECQIRLEGCSFVATVIHHKQGKSSKELYLDTSKWLASCESCNIAVENLPEAYELNLKLHRNGNS